MYCSPDTCCLPTEEGVRFSEEDIDRAMERLFLSGADGRRKAARILREWDDGHGDVDDVIDRYEDEEGY